MDLPKPVPPPVTKMRRPTRSFASNIGGFRLKGLSVNWLID
jgi:hypothetical protein